MIDLMETFAEARFGKSAFLGRLFGTDIDPKKRALRDRIEDMIREERRKRERAQKAIDYGKYRLQEAPKSGVGGWTADIARSLIPGLSISAAAALGGLIKESAKPTPESGAGGRLFDLAHLGAAGAGAGLGYASSTGSLGDVGTVTRTAKKLGDPLTSRLTKILGEGTKDIGMKHPDILALASQGEQGTLAKLLNKLSPRYWAKRVAGAPTTPEAARGFIGGEMLQAGKTGVGATEALRKLKGSWKPAVGALTSLGAGAKRIKLPGKWGAILGALAVASPFVAARLFKTRGLRASGGTAGQAAANKAEELLSGAEALRKEREGLMPQLA